MDLEPYVMTDDPPDPPPRKPFAELSQRWTRAVAWAWDAPGALVTLRVPEGRIEVKIGDAVFRLAYGEKTILASTSEQESRASSGSGDVWVAVAGGEADVGAGSVDSPPLVSVAVGGARDVQFRSADGATISRVHKR